MSSRTLLGCLLAASPTISPLKIVKDVIRFYKPLPRHTAVLNPDVENALEASEMKHRCHPGIRKLRCVQLPPQLVAAIDTVLINSGQELRQLMSESEELSDHLWQRHLPVEPQELQAKMRTYEREVASKDGKNLEELPEEERQKVELQRRSKVLKKVAELTSRWKPISYDAHRSLLYLLARAGKDYAVLHQVFSELQKVRPSFVPKTLLDFGSGVGTVTWAARSFWKDALSEILSVDVSSDMNSMATLLLKDGKEDSNPTLQGVLFRQYLPMSGLIKYDLVVSAFSLMELPSLRDRLETVEALWQKTQSVLVLIENGNMAGYTALVQARDYILNVFDPSFKNASSQVAHVLAPCPHDKCCPKFGEQEPIPCCFRVPYQPLPHWKKPPMKAKFSYVILHKGKRGDGDPSWPRIVRPVLCKSRHVICRLCCSDGQLKEVIFTRAKQGRHAYRCARASEWGDLLPVEIKKMEAKQEPEEFEDKDDNLS